MKGLINGAHTIIGSTDAHADRAFFRDVLGFESVDAGGRCSPCHRPRWRYIQGRTDVTSFI